MRTTLNEDVKNIAIKYFTDIVYIDDALINPRDFFQKNITQLEQAAGAEGSVLQDASPSFRRPMRKNIGQFESQEIEGTLRQDNSVVDMSDHTSAFDLLYEFQQLGCKASPYYFESAQSIDQAVRLIEMSHLTILDWELDSTEGETTVKILNLAIDNKKRMKMIVIYTRSPDKARNSLQENYENFPPVSIKGKTGTKYDLIKMDNALILICDKQSFNAEEILETFISQIISNYGYFPFGFFDAINKMNDQTALILQRFSYPFDNALILQLSSSGISQNDYAQIVSKMISNHLYKSLELNPIILQSIIDNWKVEIQKLRRMKQEEFLKFINEYIDDICGQHKLNSSNGKINVSYLRLLKHVEYEKWQSYLHLLDRLDLFKTKPFNELQELVMEDLLIIKTKLELEKHPYHESLESVDSKIKEEYVKMYGNKFKEKMFKVLEPLIPVIFVFLLSSRSKAQNIRQSVRELVDIMKVVPYDSVSISEVDSLSGERLINYFSSGDLLFGQNSKVLACISPSCDAFNPATKVEYSLKFICGTIIDKDSSFQNLKEGQHISVLPKPDSPNDLICIKWDFYKTEIIDIKNNFSNYRTYTRPYRFEQSYCQQIINSYLSYHSRSGVDELFFKKDSSMRNFFVFTND
ncbi:response regulator receiver domain [Paenibacillus sp. KS-LC4]|uniref:response regulator receiver domain n=1 Tax=Paenibacillus sp. KS-LC4 TaxID=2979727 RepID=UPI0030D537C9